MSNVRFQLTGIGIMMLLSSSLLAAGFQQNQTSPSLEGSAMAGSAATGNDVTALFNNPATLATLSQSQIYVGGNEFFKRLEVHNAQAVHVFNVPGSPPSDIRTIVSGLAHQDNAANSHLFPIAYVGSPVTERLSLGFSLLEPYYFSNNYSNNSVLRFASLETHLKSLNFNPSLGYQINDSWLVGFGVQAQHLKASFANFYGPYMGDAFMDSLLAASNPSFLNNDGWGFGYTLGLLYKIKQFTRFGISYRSEINTHLTGRGMQYTTVGDVVASPSDYFLYNSFTSAETHIKTPAVLTLGATHDINQWTLKATAQVNFWHPLRNLTVTRPNAFIINNTIPLHARNTWFGSLGADYRATSALTLRAGLAYDQTPTNSTIEFPDNNQFWLNAGFSYYLSQQFSFDGAYSHVFENNHQINTSQTGITSFNHAGPIEINQLRANYKGSANSLAFGLRYSC